MRKKRSATRTKAAPPAEPSFIFRGTVLHAKQSTVPDVKPDGRTVIVRVDEVIAAPPALARIAGRAVTVVDSTATKPGQQAIFHASSVSFGQEVAVRAIRAQPLASVGPTGGIVAARAAAAPFAATSNAAVDPVQAHRDLLLKRSLDNADVVVAGTITEVRIPPEARTLAPSTVTSAVGGRASAVRRRGATGVTRGTTASLPRISEHDPIWHEAVVNVESVEKGSTGLKQVTVRFPGSNDVRWRNHPKLRPGQQGVFLLSGGSVPVIDARAPLRSRAAGGARLTTTPLPLAQREAMQAMSELQPISAIQKVRQLLSQSPASALATSAPPSSRRVRSPRARKTVRARGRNKG